MVSENYPYPIFLVGLIIVLWCPLVYSDTLYPNVQWSPHGDHLIISDFYSHQFLILDLKSSDSIAIKGTLTGGSQATWSPDGSRIGFKIVRELPDGSRGQTAAIFDVNTRQVIPLYPLVPRAGNPDFSQEGAIAFTIGKQMLILDQNLIHLKTIDLPAYANTIAFSPDGRHIIYNDEHDVLFQVDLRNDSHARITESGQGYCRPDWSPDGEKVLLNSISGELLIINPEQDTRIKLGPALHPIWTRDSRAVLASRRILHDEHLIGIDMVQCSEEGNCQVIFSQQDVLPLPKAINPTGDILCFQSQGEFYLLDLSQPERASSLQNLVIPTAVSEIEIPRVSTAVREFSLSPRALSIIGSVPYHHQQYCTKLTLAVACGATSATMAIAYYDKFNYWDFTATTPFTHTSHYGNYVSEIYTYNGFTFNIWGEISSEPTYGAHGYIWQDPVDTKTHMMEYIEYHDIDSAVDWSPTWSELQTKVGERHPFVLLSLITESGHYKTVVGYHLGQHTAIFNDPYGNKNDDPYKDFNGACVSYDWPGYNNGFA
ncbi:C39 family peptidase, partial [candidate division CSSED10-310 bacterium]